MKLKRYAFGKKNWSSLGFDVEDSTVASKLRRALWLLRSCSSESAHQNLHLKSDRNCFQDVSGGMTWHDLSSGGVPTCNILQHVHWRHGALLAGCLCQAIRTRKFFTQNPASLVAVPAQKEVWGSDQNKKCPWVPTKESLQQRIDGKVAKHWNHFRLYCKPCRRRLYFPHYLIYEI